MEGNAACGSLPCACVALPASGAAYETARHTNTIQETAPRSENRPARTGLPHTRERVACVA